MLSIFWTKRTVRVSKLRIWKRWLKSSRISTLPLFAAQTYTRTLRTSYTPRHGQDSKLLEHQSRNFQMTVFSAKLETFEKENTIFTVENGDRTQTHHMGSAWKFGKQTAGCIGATSKMAKSQGTADLLLEMTQMREMSTRDGGSMDSFTEKASSYGKTDINTLGNGKWVSCTEREKSEKLMGQSTLGTG